MPDKKNNNLKSVDYYADLAEDLYDNPESGTERELWEKIDDIHACILELPASISRLEYIGPNAKFAPTLPRDIIQSVVRFIASNDPRIDGVLKSPDPAERDKLDGVETVLRYQYTMMNNRYRVPPRIQIAADIVKYSSCAFQTRFMPYEARRKDKKSGGGNLYSQAERDEMLYHGDMGWLVTNRQNVYPQWTNNGVLKSVMHVSVPTLQDLLDEFGEDNEVVRRAIRHVGEKTSALRDCRVSRFNVENAYCRTEWFTINGLSDNVITGEQDRYVLQHAEHDLGFLPWVIVDYGEPLLKGIVDSGLYTHLGIMRAIIGAKALGQAAWKNRVVTVPDPNNPDIVDNEDDPNNEMIVRGGTTVTSLLPPPIDQQLMGWYSELKQEFVTSLAARSLIALEDFIGGRTPSSSINAAQQTALTQLGLIREAYENAHARGIHQMLQWMWATKEHSLGYRAEKSGLGNTPFTSAGAQFMLAPKNVQLDSVSGNVVEFDPKDIRIRVTTKPSYIQDKQAAINAAILEQQAGLSQAESWENNGLTDSPDYSKAKRLEEEYEKMFVANDMEQMRAMIQAEVQQAMQQQQQAMQQQQQQAASPEQNVRDMSSAPFNATRGMDSRFGGPSPADVAPGESRTTLNGRDEEGRPLA